MKTDFILLLNIFRLSFSNKNLLIISRVKGEGVSVVIPAVLGVGGAHPEPFTLAFTVLVDSEFVIIVICMFLHRRWELESNQ